MNITVELYGIPRQKVGAAQVAAEGATLGEVLADLEARYPALAESCIHQGRLAKEYAANLSGDRFVTDPNTPIESGATLLILSADAGG